MSEQQVTTATGKGRKSGTRMSRRIPAGEPAMVTAEAVRPDGPVAVDPATRRSWIERAAYFRAERRGFAPGHEAEDWLEAEAEIDAQLRALRSRA